MKRNIITASKSQVLAKVKTAATAAGALGFFKMNSEVKGQEQAQAFFGTDASARIFTAALPAGVTFSGPYKGQTHYVYLNY